MNYSTLYDLASDLLTRCPLCGLDRLEDENDCERCFERQVRESVELAALDNEASSSLDTKILPIGFDLEG